MLPRTTGHFLYVSLKFLDTQKGLVAECKFCGKPLFVPVFRKMSRCLGKFLSFRDSKTSPATKAGLDVEKILFLTGYAA